MTRHRNPYRRPKRRPTDRAKVDAALRLHGIEPDDIHNARTNNATFASPPISRFDGAIKRVDAPKIGNRFHQAEAHRASLPPADPPEAGQTAAPAGSSIARPQSETEPELGLDMGGQNALGRLDKVGQ